MLGRIALYTVALLIFVASPARSQDGAPDGKTGFEVAGTLGYGLPLGDASEDIPFSDIFSGKVPFVLDAGYRITPNVYAGAYFQYAIALVADESCPERAECSGSVIRYGVEGQYHFMPEEQLDPWFGIGLGLESAGVDLEAGGQEAASSLDGLEFLHLTGGLDYRLNENLAIGPALTFTLGQYTDAEVRAGNITAGGEITNKTLHEWLVLGIRGRFNL